MRKKKIWISICLTKHHDLFVYVLTKFRFGHIILFVSVADLL